jgi:hypothetical protein
MLSLMNKPIIIIVLSMISMALQAQNDWENPAIFERNQTEAHAPLTPYENM